MFFCIESVPAQLSSVQNTPIGPFRLPGWFKGFSIVDCDGSQYIESAISGFEHCSMLNSAVEMSNNLG